MDLINQSAKVLPRKIKGVIHRPLEAIDLEIIFRDAGSWWLYYALLLFTGLRIIDVAMLVYWNIDHERGVLRRPEGRTGRFSEWHLPSQVLAQIPIDQMPSVPLFPQLYTDIEDKMLCEEAMYLNLAEPINYLQALLSIADRPTASLFSFTLTHRYLFKDRDPSEPEYLDMKISIAHLLKNTGGPVVFN